MKVILHGELRKRYGDQFEIEARSAAEAIEGLSRQLHDWPSEMCLDVPGFHSEDRLHAETDVKEIHLVPAMFGGGAVGRILVGIALIAVSLIPGVGTFLGATLTTALVSAGIGMALGGVMALFMKAPTISKSEDPPSSKYFGVNENTAASGTPITLAYGRINLFGHWLSLQSDADKIVVGTFPASPA
jgi:predicted phage tail protein